MIVAALPGGRLHLQHGPIDCICRADGAPSEVEVAYAQAARAFEHALGDLCAELGLLRTALPSPRPRGACAGRMHDAVAAQRTDFITPMAAVAGAVADYILAALVRRRALRRAFVNNGGDIAIHLAPGATLAVGIITDLGAPACDATLTLARSCGVATSGRACKGRGGENGGGRSFSLGIADAVTVIAGSGALADAAATVIANAVDLPGNRAITRRPASSIDPDSDLGSRMVTTGLGVLTTGEIDAALCAGRRAAGRALADGLIDGAVLALRGRMVSVGAEFFGGGAVASAPEANRPRLSTGGASMVAHH